MNIDIAINRRPKRLRSTLAALLLHAMPGGVLIAGSSSPALAQERSDTLRLAVMEIAQSVDLSRGREKFLTLTVEISGGSPVRLRRVQPMREDFTVLAGKQRLHCRWLRGGALPEDPERLRFTLGFSMPSPPVKTIALEANLPRLENADAVELRLNGLAQGSTAQERAGDGWSVTVVRFEEGEYEAPSLPPSGRFTSKAGPVDARVYRSPGTGAPPTRAFILRWRSNQADLYDRTVDLSGRLILEGGGTTPLLSALLKRDPSAAIKKAPYGPFVDATFYFTLPVGKRPTGASVTLTRRPIQANAKPLRITGLPVP